MAENTCEKAVASKPCWGAVRWADLTVSDASNSWIYNQSDTKNESKSIGLTSLLQKNIKLNDSSNEFICKEPAASEGGAIKVPNRGFLTTNCLTTLSYDKSKEPNLSQDQNKVSSESYDRIKKNQGIESEEIKFGDEKFKSGLIDTNRSDQSIKGLIQSASLNTPKIFGDLPPNTSKCHSNNKKRTKDDTENSEDSENININSEIQVNQVTIFKKIKHSKTSAFTSDHLKIKKSENNQNMMQERNSQKKISSNQHSTPRRTKNISNKSPLVGTPKTPQFNGNSRSESSVDHASSSNVDWNKRISSRLFQIAIGKGTRAYQNFLKLKPKKENRDPNDPQTPNAHVRCPQKHFTDQLNQWRKSLHQYDDPDSCALEL
ncbi:putative histone mRNA hairpin-binding protein [Cryptosporidium canis]|uniref:Histone mRNA hairpin-binding protein n=1 Tax=Cryptosporidium canis TaxID=195482 RepID=A0ABQ8PBF9_9CRYT|nr:putative histone mRNA hairpin-binding protein [Cryptosporidium canis]KAJ1615229.1 putative histone mRNA hairpin-binding protein [Cryptosporidium canis]